jgi:hypothetical protein
VRVSLDLKGWRMGLILRPIKRLFGGVAGLNWLQTGSDGKLFYTRQWIVDIYKGVTIYLPDECQKAHQVWLRNMELLRYSGYWIINYWKQKYDEAYGQRSMKLISLECLFILQHFNQLLIQSNSVITPWKILKVLCRYKGVSLQPRIIMLWLTLTN